MTVVKRFLKWVRQIWRKMTNWVLFWKYKHRPMFELPKKYPIKGAEKTTTDFDLTKLVTPQKESRVCDLDMHLGVLEPDALATVLEKPVVDRESRENRQSPESRGSPGSRGSRESRSLIRLSQTAVQSVSTLMFSALQSGWQLCRWKSSMSSASVSSTVRTRSALETPEAEMLREVYLILWVIRKQLRELARRQERRRRRRIRSQVVHVSRHSEPVQGLKQDARSPL